MSLPFAAFPICSSSDPDESASVLSRELSDARFESVLNRNQFSFELNGFHMERTTVAFNQLSTRSKLNAGIVEGRVIVSVSVGPPTVLRLDGQAVGTDQIAVISPGTRVEVNRAAGSGELTLRADLKAIESRFRELTGLDLQHPIRFERSVDRSQPFVQPIIQYLFYLANGDGMTDAMLKNPVLRAGVDDMLLSAILSLPSNYSEALRGGRCHPAELKVVRRAEEFLQAHATEPITMSDVVAECGCSRRTLFHTFRQRRGYTPMQFLQECRLNSAHAALLRSSPNQTVTSIALSCGFSHLGRFAKCYRERFGENPSATRRKSSHRSYIRSPGADQDT